jgi:uncharacterized protein
MKPSHYNLFVDNGETVYALNLLSRSAIRLSRDAFETYRALARNAPCTNDAESHELSKVLRDRKFLVDDDFDEIAYIRYRSHRDRYDNRTLGLVISPTLGCNFSCHYCFENKTDETLTEDNQNRLLELVAANLRGKEVLGVQWFGGEPLNALPVIERLSNTLPRLSQTATIFPVKRLNCSLILEYIVLKSLSMAIGNFTIGRDLRTKARDRLMPSFKTSGRPPIY